MTSILSLVRTQLVVLAVDVLDPRLVNPICDSSNRRSYKLALTSKIYTEEGIVLRKVGWAVLVTKNEFLLSDDPADLP